MKLNLSIRSNQKIPKFFSNNFLKLYPSFQSFIDLNSSVSCIKC